MLSLILNGFIAFFSLAAWLMLAFGKGQSEELAASGTESLKYFTVISNLFNGVVSLIYLLWGIFTHSAAPVWLLALKLSSTTGVMLTFFTVILLLVEKFGWRKMYMGGNFWMHLVLPLVSAVDCVLLVPVGTLSFATTLVVLVPVMLYGAWYLYMVLKHGAEENGRVYDFYGFLRWGTDKIPVVAIGMLGATWVVGLLLWFANQILCK